jgi:hypothetical protein
MSEPLHRDDVDLETVQHLEELFAKLYPGHKIVFAGDHPDDENNQAIAEINAAFERSLVTGTCVDCGAQMPDYHPEQEHWQPATGWRNFRNIKTGEIEAWQCPACDQQEQDGEPRPFPL